MWLQFFAQNFHFAVNLFAALVCAAICWLYLDAWLGHHSKKVLFRWVGFGSLALSFLAQSTLIEQSVLGGSLLGNLTDGLIVGLRLLGYGMIIFAEIIDPLQAIPKNTGLDLKTSESKPAKAEPEPVPSVPTKPASAPVVAPAPAAAPAVKAAASVAPAVTPAKAAPIAAAPVAAAPAVAAAPVALKPAAVVAPVAAPAPKPAAPTVAAAPAAPVPPPAPKQPSQAILPLVGVVGKWLLPLGAFVIAGLYLRRATTGLERHLKPMALGFALVGVADLIGLSSLLRNTENPLLYALVAAFSWLWMASQVLLLAGVVIMGLWVWGYLTKRFFSQLFMVFMTTTFVIFFVVTVSFTGLLLRSIRSDALRNLQTAGNVLDYALGSKQAETMAGARQLAENSDIAAAVKAKDHAKLVTLTQNYLAENKQNSLVITNQSGQVLVRGQDTEQWGDSLSSDLLVRRALLGDSRSSASAVKSAGLPTVQVRSAAIIHNADGTVAGSVMTGLDLGSAFVDGIKQTTGLQGSVYAGNALAATTVVAPDGKTRSTGLLLNDKAILDKVLKSGKSYAGTFRLQNRDVLGAFLPLKDVDNATLGMLMVSEPQSNILHTAGRSIELTFLLTGLLLILSIAPIYWITKVIERQLD